ncbi:energy-coupling factor ABC transporter permease [Cupriavidus sp. SZY C1]|uniref:energy-coupling factor ABC transporter permease n=1 Tax=Cupriavidus sp. SZY C1 TaxID=3055037 RepID=UPI0028B3B7E1|nr:energy-coupling factor ABC transporter permease [Cupriavidus sp. SZY C1]MDT6962790.1 energy-coupling factor ABC transporter permease [Cupriavidus sp. SZY C1]
MDIEESSIQELLATWPLPTLAVAVLAWALAQRPWRVLDREPLQHAWLGTLVLLALLWSARATLGGGVVIQLMGATLAVTMFGLPLALVSLAVANVISLLGLAYLSGLAWQDIHWVSLAPRFVWMAAVPAFVTVALQAAMRRWLPRHLFIFILGHGYFAALLAAIVAGALRVAWLAHTGFPADVGLSAAESLTGVVVIAFGEAFLSGMLVAIFVIYRPQWVVTFADEDYLRGK